MAKELICENCKKYFNPIDKWNFHCQKCQPLNKKLTSEEEFVKSKIKNDWSGMIYLGFYEDEEINVFDLLKEYAQAKVKPLIEKYHNEWDKNGMGSGISYSALISDLEKL